VSLGWKADRLLSSPLSRAWQTGEIALTVGLAPSLELAQALAPDGDPLPLLPGWLRPASGEACHRLLLVGHEPDLGLLAARLLGAAPGSISLRKAGMALLRLPSEEAGPPGPGSARLEWLVQPKLLLART